MKQKPYKPTKRAIRKWFNYYNEILFDGVLVYPKIVEIRRRRGCHADVELLGMNLDGIMTTRLCMNDKFKETEKLTGFELFQSVLAHEMVHIFQFSVGNSGSHNKMFYSFRPLFEENNLQLSLRY